MNPSPPHALVPPRALAGAVAVAAVDALPGRHFPVATNMRTRPIELCRVVCLPDR